VGVVDGGGPPDAPVTPVPLFDLEAIRDPVTANCQFTGQRTVIEGTVVLDVWDVSYDSWESIDGELVTIRMRGFAARPVSPPSALPGVVQAHGLGGFASENDAASLAARLGMFTLAYTGPGGGDAPENTSEGRPASWDGGYRMFDTLPDPRGSWFWGHAVAGLRALTCLEHHPGVDPARLGMTGFSAGAVATLMAAGVDDRIKAAVPLSGTGAWDVATQAPAAWQHALLMGADLTIDSPEWLRLEEVLDAVNLLPGAAGAILMVNGSTDEFFPLTAHVATFGSIPGADKRTSIAGNFDHGCYLVSGVESAGDIEARATIRAEGGQRFWFRHWFATDADYAALPSAPSVTLTPVGAATWVQATVGDGGPGLDVEEVKIWWSNDDSLVYGSLALDDAGGGVYTKLAGFPLQPNTISYVDAQYRTTDILFPERFSLSSAPSIPPGLVPTIRQISTCLP
jgi:dienelactone hydrolase